MNPSCHDYVPPDRRQTAPLYPAPDGQRTLRTVQYVRVLRAEFSYLRVHTYTCIRKVRTVLYSYEYSYFLLQSVRTVPTVQRTRIQSINKNKSIKNNEKSEKDFKAYNNIILSLVTTRVPTS